MANNKLILTFFGLLLLLSVGCDRGDNERLPADEGLVEVCFNAEGAGLSVTRAGDNLSVGTPVSVTAYRRSDPATAATPVTAWSATNSYTVNEEGTLDGDVMKLLSGYTYDFYALANAPALAAGRISTVENGTDLMVGQWLGEELVPGTATVNVDFTLAHLGSQIVFQSYPSDELKETISSFVVESVYMGGISETASLLLNPAIEPQALTVSGTDGDFTMTDFADVDSAETEMLVEGRDVILPRAEGDISMVIDFMVNGSATVIRADRVAIPALLAGHSYIFQLELGVTEMTLTLIYGDDVPWSDIDWSSSMGGGMALTLGSWSVISWDSGMGGGTVLTIGNWNRNNWASEMGE